MMRNSIVLFLLLTPVITAGQPYDLTTIDHNLGLHYEKIDDVQMKTGEWILATTVNLTNLEPEPNPINYYKLCDDWNETVPFNTIKFKDMIHSLNSMDPYHQCVITLGIDIIEEHRRELESLKFQLPNYGTKKKKKDHLIIIDEKNVEKFVRTANGKKCRKDRRTYLTIWDEKLYPYQSRK